ncbi:MAG: ATP-binding protein, partial [Firmicutes bacterium]|nr:ATP-binding protein [Bacillota bacterium]
MNIRDLTEQVDNLISLKKEGDHWDFKREWYCNKADLLHDIICMANNLSSQDGLIIIGVDEDRDYEIQDIVEDSNRKKTQDLVSFLRKKKFAGGIRPTVTVQPVRLSQKTIDVIIVRNDRNTPYYLTEHYQGVFANNIYARIMDTNTPKNSSSDINIIETLWKKRFAINATALERVILYLQRPADWIDSSDESRMYYKYAPEFVIEQVSAADDRDGYEFYLFGQYDSRPHWYDINLYYHQTLLDSLGGTALDGGRYFTATPNTAGLSLDGYRTNWDVT